MDARDALLQDLKLTLAELFMHLGDSTAVPSSCVHAYRALYVIENVLGYGLNNLAWVGKTSLFEYFEHLPDCLPGTADVLEAVRRRSRSPAARTRIFIRTALNEGSFAEYMRALAWNTPLTQKYFDERSVLRSAAHNFVFVTRLESLKVLTFNLSLDEPGLDHEDYWMGVNLEILPEERTAQPAQAAQQEPAGPEAEQAPDNPEFLQKNLDITLLGRFVSWLTNAAQWKWVRGGMNQKDIIEMAMAHKEQQR
eukprot:m51a1_g7120 hypothetical protein (252) ;mRNA; f:118416-126028